MASKTWILLRYMQEENDAEFVAEFAEAGARSRMKEAIFEMVVVRAIQVTRPY